MAGGGSDGFGGLHRGAQELVEPEQEMDDDLDDFQDLIPVANDKQENQAEATRDARSEQELTQEDVSAERRQFTASGAPPPPGMRKRRGPGGSGQSVGTQNSPDDSEEAPDDNQPVKLLDDDEENRVEGHVWSTVAASPPPPPSSNAPSQISMSWLAPKDPE